MQTIEMSEVSGILQPEWTAQEASQVDALSVRSNFAQTV